MAICARPSATELLLRGDAWFCAAGRVRVREVWQRLDFLMVHDMKRRAVPRQLVFFDAGHRQAAGRMFFVLVALASLLDFQR